MTTTRSAGSHRTGSATAKDGARIGFHSYGSGPGVVLLHGAMQSGVSQRDLAQLLAVRATVHLVDRRGRGLSDPYAPGSTVGFEVDDLAAVLAETGSRSVIGVSSGALIALRAALSVPDVQRLVLFEPPLLLQAPDPEPLARCARELEAGDVPAAMVTAMIAAEMGPGFLRLLPRALLVRMTRSMLARDDRREDPDRPRVRTLAEVVTYDLALVQEEAGRLSDFAEVGVPTLLLSGAKSRPYLKAAVSGLASTLPNARQVELPGLNHGATQNSDEWGKPAVVAPAVLEFLQASSD